MSRVITAAGGLVFRSSKGRRQVLVIHRPRYDDWSLPKGKHDDGETNETAALREIEEETGVRGRILAPLDDVEYMTANGNPKQVFYFAVRALESPKFVANNEVDRLEWMSKKDAISRLTYSHDRQLVRSTSLKQLNGIGHVHLVRHAAAGDRSAWTGDDRDRPLTTKGVRQAEMIADRLGPRWASSVLSSPYVRCMQTGKPLAKRLGTRVERTDFLAEGSRGKGLLDYVFERPGDELFMVSHGDVIPSIVDKLASRGVPLISRSPDGRLDCKKASDWILTTHAGKVVGAEYVPPPVDQD